MFYENYNTESIKVRVYLCFLILMISIIRMHIFTQMKAIKAKKIYLYLLIYIHNSFSSSSNLYFLERGRFGSTVGKLHKLFSFVLISKWYICENSNENVFTFFLQKMFLLFLALRCWNNGSSLKTSYNVKGIVWKSSTRHQHGRSRFYSMTQFVDRLQLSDF